MNEFPAMKGFPVRNLTCNIQKSDEVIVQEQLAQIT
jgi:hypothetical protein